MQTSPQRSVSLMFLLSAQAFLVLLYTVYVACYHGMDLFPIFVDNIIGMNWSGQFNLDFSCYLLLSGVWIVWRNNYKPFSLLLALCATIIGIICFAPYVVYLLVVEKGNVVKVLIGERVYA